MTRGAAVSSGDVPVDLGREEARELARQELADPVYDAEPSLVDRVVGWVVDRIDDLLGDSGVLPGWAAVAVVLAVLALAAVVVWQRTGPMARRASSEEVFGGRRRSAAEYRAAADAAAADGDWAAAVVERFRAIVSGLEERGVLDHRPGRTADEAAADAAAAMRPLAADLRTGSRVFDGVRYGGHPATSADDARMAQLDAAVLAARPRPVASDDRPPAVPR
ncbi:MAG: DUF4129 domain-containing protein [Jiangellaceae bacterium]